MTVLEEAGMLPGSFTQNTLVVLELAHPDSHQLGSAALFW